MTRADNSKRSFLKKVATAVGFVAAAGYFRNLISTHSNSIQAINDNSENDVSKQKKAWPQKQWAPMTDSDKQQMLDEILNNHSKHQA